MKKTITLLALALMAFSFSACDKAADLLKFNHSFSKEFTIPAVVPTNGLQEVSTPTINTSIDSLLTAHNITLDVIKEIKITSLKVTATEFDGSATVPDSVFNDFDAVEILMTAGSLGEKSIAVASDISGESKVLDFTVTDDNVKDYLIQNNIGITLKMSTNSGSTESIKANLEMGYQISGGL